VAGPVKSYIQFREYLYKQDMWLDWNDENQEYDIVKSFDSVNQVVVTLPHHTVWHNYQRAVEIVNTAVGLNSLFL
jgi:hypothetical protein